MVSEEKAAELKKMGVRDSKLLSPRRRSFLYHKLKELADDYAVLKLTAMDIDKLRSEQNLNKIELARIQQILNALKPDFVYVDSVESQTEKFFRKILAGLDRKLREKYEYGRNFICENFADRKYPVVGAASIIAKVVRDGEIRKLQEKYGDFGSGYTSDPRTIAFLKKWLAEKGSLPFFVRRSWVTARELKKDHEQKRLGEFVKNGEELYSNSK